MSDIKVVLGTNFKREAVLINPKIPVADPQGTAENPEPVITDNVIAKGSTTAELLEKNYGKGF